MRARAIGFVLLAVVVIAPVPIAAQEPAAVPSGASGTVASEDSAIAPPHRFWDAGNIALVGGVVASRALDFKSTEHFRALGDTEWLLTNRIVDNKSLFAAIEVAGAAASVAVAYWLHRTHHHTLERWVMAVHTGVTTGGAVHNYSLKAP